MSGTRRERSLVITLHEIYGVNDHIAAFNETLEKEGFDTLIPNLLGRESFAYGQAEEAYAYFMREIGFDGALEAIRPIIAENKAKDRRVYVAGFSIGATLAWRCSEFEVDGVLGYYGSRIRSYPEIEPSCPALLFFASKESFDVAELAGRLKKKRNAAVEILNAEHGFMNPFCPAFDSSAHRYCMEQSLEFLKRLDGLREEAP
ncbi:dienelactone hydrolase family protein [Cohnella thailandensis]|uniref:Dienelactone hydrolase family protein n=1 Tax=Cohnella thailandensis TaxID=557557 RepID=A0A841SY94_9BACL|nr:dienelactone hydrolase family protein [Cohnella thailandensis]MBB6635195.1 dienelactone hydrolase family protein [Cohnella thailandensis]MBP1974339.1 dienelactone hydrolase [Cohnella thailandensis]